MLNQDPKLAQILDKQPADILALINALRELIASTAPHLTEEAKPGWGNILYKASSYVCAISPQKKYVDLNFHRGTNLPDPDGLLEGTGKNLRHVKIRTMDDVGKPGVRKLIEEAVRLDQQPG